MNQKKMVISEDMWNELFGGRDDEEEFVGFDAESEEGCDSDCYRVRGCG